mgnify:CR=1 FL=1
MCLDVDLGGDYVGYRHGGEKGMNTNQTKLLYTTDGLFV